MSTNDGGPAFPNRWADGHEDMGMSLRDWFAGQALGAVIEMFGTHAAGAATTQNFATEAYRIADAMLAHRNKED